MSAEILSARDLSLSSAASTLSLHSASKGGSFSLSEKTITA